MATLINKKPVEISKEFFKKYTTCAEVSRIVYGIESKSKTKTIGSVTRLYREWKEKSYLDNKRISKGKGTITAYRLNFNIFFENVKPVFNKKERKFLEYIFELPKVREMACSRGTLLDGIISVLEKVFFYNFITEEPLFIEIAKAFFVEDKRQFKKINDSSEQYEEFWRVIIDFLDPLSNKIKDITNFNAENYRELRFKTKINKYSDIPFTIPNYYSEKEKENLLKRWEIVFYEKRKPTNDEMLDTK